MRALLPQRKIVFARKLAFAIGVVFSATGCGGGFYHTGSASSSQAISTGGDYYSPTLDPATAPDTGSTTTGTASAAPMSIPVSATGYSAFTTQVNARSILRIRFTPGRQKQMGTSGTLQQYGQLGVYISVGSQTQPTPMLGNGYLGGTAQGSGVLDFSSAFAQRCTASDTSCRQNITITVDHPNSDYNCLMGLYCPWTKMPDGMPWNGTLTVQTDDTGTI